MARISALDLKQRFSTEDGNIRILQKMKKQRKNQSKIREQVIGNKNGTIRHFKIMLLYLLLSIYFRKITG